MNGCMARREGRRQKERVLWPWELTAYPRPEDQRQNNCLWWSCGEARDEGWPVGEGAGDGAEVSNLGAWENAGTSTKIDPSVSELFFKPPTFSFTRTDFQGVLWYPQPPAKPAQRVWNVDVVLNLLNILVFKSKYAINKQKNIWFICYNAIRVEMKHKRRVKKEKVLYSIYF